MPDATPTPQTTLFVIVFALIYLFMVLRMTLYGKLDLYDLFMLSMVAIVPAAFTLLPSIANRLSHIMGVTFPFIIMFGALFLVVFVFMHSVTARLHKLERQNSALVQELGLLSLELEHGQRLLKD